MTDPRNRMPDETPQDEMTHVVYPERQSKMDSLKEFVANIREVANDPDTEKLLLYGWAERATQPTKSALFRNGFKVGGDFLSAISTAVAIFAKEQGVPPLLVAEALVTKIRRMRK